MKEFDYELSLSCPKCKTKIKKGQDRCNVCGFITRKKDKIWELLYSPSSKTKSSQKGYEVLHKKVSGGPKDGSYDILAAFAKGNRTIDIACGEGHIEKLAPDTVGVDFSLNALLKARDNGVKYLVQADAENLPFLANSFDVSICNGSLEHFQNPLKALKEMARISKIQVLVVHKEFGFPGSSLLRKIVEKVFGMKNQPIEHPLTMSELENMAKNEKLHIVYKGVWTFPINYGQTISSLPVINVPSCHFIITIK